MTDELTATGRIHQRRESGERILVIGDGPVARALSLGLARASARVDRWWRKQGGTLPAADVVVLAVRDTAIGEVAARVMGSLSSDATLPILLHCAGALPAEAPFAGLQRRPLGVGLLHPLRALAGAADDAELGGTVFGVEGDEPGRDAALRLVRRLGGEALELDAGQLARYHAAAVLVSNHAVGLVDAGAELLMSVGLPRDEAVHALAGLLASAAANLQEVGLPKALTGPIARGDVDGVARHLLALAPSRELLALYRTTARRVTKVAAEKGGATADALERIRALLGPSSDGD